MLPLQNATALRIRELLRVDKVPDLAKFVKYASETNDVDTPLKKLAVDRIAVIEPEKIARWLDESLSTRNDE
jgi:hypothetical protein